RVALMTWSTPARVLMSAWMKRSDEQPAGRDRAVVRTVAPPKARRFTTAAPIPLVPPVTRARLPANSVPCACCSVCMYTSASSSIVFPFHTIPFGCAAAPSATHLLAGAGVGDPFEFYTLFLYKVK